MKTGPRVAQSDTPFAGSCATCGALLDRTHLEEAPDGLHCVFCGAPQDWITDAHEQVTVPAGVGEALREARQARGESLEHAAAVTHINERFLRALEDDEPSGAFPGAIYGRFFLREYAEHLALEPTPLVRGFDDAAVQAEVQPMVDAVTPRPVGRDTRIAAVIATILLVVLATASWWTGGSGGARSASEGLPRSTVDSTASVGRTTPPMDAGTPPSVATPGITIVVRIADRCWVHAIVDGRTLPDRTMLPGSEWTLRARHTLELTLGNAGGARVWVKGHEVRTGADGDVTTLSFAWRNGDLIRTRGAS